MEQQPSRYAAELFVEGELDDPALELLREGQTSLEFVEELVEAALYPEAVKALARALPKRRAVQWLCGCARSNLGPDVRKQDLACLDAAESWVEDASEDNRCAALQAAEAAGMDQPLAWAAAAAGWSGGSLSPPELPAVPPPEQLTAQAVAGAIMVLAAAEPGSFDQSARDFLETGMKLAR